LLEAGSGVSTVPVPADLASKTAMAQTAKKLALSLDGFNESGMSGDKEQPATSFCPISDSSRWGKATSRLRALGLNGRFLLYQKKMNLRRFARMLERRKVSGQGQWWGTFEYGSKQLKVTAILEKN
jgi:hypothetical protein